MLSSIHTTVADLGLQLLPRFRQAALYRCFVSFDFTLRICLDNYIPICFAKYLSGMPVFTGFLEPHPSLYAIFTQFLICPLLKIFLRL